MAFLQFLPNFLFFKVECADKSSKMAEIRPKNEDVDFSFFEKQKMKNLRKMKIFVFCWKLWVEPNKQRLQKVHFPTLINIIHQLRRSLHQIIFGLFTFKSELFWSHSELLLWKLYVKLLPNSIIFHILPFLFDAKKSRKIYLQSYLPVKLTIAHNRPLVCIKKVQKNL